MRPLSLFFNHSPSDLTLMKQENTILGVVLSKQSMRVSAINRTGPTNPEEIVDVLVRMTSFLYC